MNGNVIDLRPILAQRENERAARVPRLGEALTLFDRLRAEERAYLLCLWQQRLTQGRASARRRGGAR